MTRLSSADWSL